MKSEVTVILLMGLLLLTGCSEKPVPASAGADGQGHSPPTQATVRANAAVLKTAPFGDRQDFADAERGLVARMPDLRVENASGDLAWDQSAYSFISGDAPGSVNPSLWRQAQLNNMHGLYKVTDGVYQLRGHDLANMSIIEGERGWIVVDPLTSRETAAAAMRLARQHLANKPVVAILFTHSHIDHFGGVLGVVTAQEAEQESIRVIAPEGFMEEVASENIIAGIAMSRRSQYMYGSRLARTERGHVGSGLGKNPALGTFGLLAPTELINHDTGILNIDGIEFEFQYTPESEAPAEFTFYLPQLKAFCGAELVSNNLHNLYTLRGAKVRNALKWSNYIGESLDRFGDAEVYFASHHWPKWGNSRIVSFLKVQRDTYKYIHDQTVRMFNAGYTPLEIAEELELPPSLRTTFSNRDYYGTLRHNARAVYQAYLGWYDANPAHLNPLPPVQAGKRYVAAMGGAQPVLEQAARAFEQGDYRWVAELLNHLVFAEPGNTAAKALLARSYDQLGYQAESGPWRDVYLTAAYELRHGAPVQPIVNLAAMREVVAHTPVPMMFDSMAVRLHGPRAEGVELRLKFVFSDLNESYMLTLDNSVLHHRPARADEEADATLELTHELFLSLALKESSLTDTLLSDDLHISGSKLDLVRFFALQDQAPGPFNVVVP